MTTLCKLKELKNSLRISARNDAVFLLPSASGRTIGFIVDIGRRNIPFDNTTAAKFADRENILDTLMDGSYLPIDAGNPGGIEDMEFSNTFYNPENRLRRSLQFKSLTTKHLSELDYFMLHICMTEN